MINTKEFYLELKNNDVNFYTGVPDSLLKYFCACISDNESENHIIAANEGNAIAIGTGYYLATKKIPLIYMQNSGIGNTVNPIISLTSDSVYSIPLLLIIGWRGQPGIKDEPQHINQGKITEDLLKVLDVEYEILSIEEDEYKEQINRLLLKAKTDLKPKALIVRKNSFSDYSYKNDIKYITDISREDALEVILDNLDKSTYVFSTTGKTSREVFELREKYNQTHEKDFLTVGSMGHTSSIALGFSKYNLANTICIDGDGALLMHLGSLAVNKSHGKENFKYILINNYCHESVGGQKTVFNNVNATQLFKSVGFYYCKTVDNLADLEKVLKSKEFINNSYAIEVLVRTGARKDLGRPTISPKECKNNLMRKI
ncbi:phosphonopyruvate decarboxylase [Mycoplasmatota bacterium WC30]